MLRFYVLLTAARMVRMVCCQMQCDPATNDRCLTRPFLTTRNSNKDYDGYIVEILQVTHLPKNEPPEVLVEVALSSTKASKELANIRLLDDSCRNRLVITYFCQSYRLLVEDCNTLYDYAEHLTHKILLVQEVMDDFLSCKEMDIYTISDELNTQHMDFHSIDMLVYSKAVNDLNVVSSVTNPVVEMMNTSFPIIWTMWWQGWQFAPPIAQKCVESWRKHHPDWSLILLDKDNVEPYFSIHEFFPHLNLTHITSRNVVHYTDIIRLGLLYRYGGIWTDATVLCHKPLEPFLWNPVAGFFSFDNTLGLNMITTWFLTSVSHGYIVQRMFDETIQYWKNKDEADEYFWVNNIFMSLYQIDEEFHRIWNTRSKLPHEMMRLTHLMQQLMFDDPKNFAIPLQRFVYHPERFVPMSKLTYKYTSNETTERSFLTLLLTNRLVEVEDEIGSENRHQILSDDALTSDMHRSSKKSLSMERFIVSVRLLFGILLRYSERMKKLMKRLFDVLASCVHY